MIRSDYRGLQLRALQIDGKGEDQRHCRRTRGYRVDGGMFRGITGGGTVAEDYCSGFPRFEPQIG